MRLIEETTVEDAALPIAPFKAHLQLGTGFGTGDVQDEVLLGFLRAALAAVEARTGKILFERRFCWFHANWRWGGALDLPTAPVQTVQEVAVIDRDGDETIWLPSNYRLEQDTHRPRLRPAQGGWPVVPEGCELRVRFVAGYGSDWEDIPADLKQAVLMLAAHYYEYRQDTGLGEGCMPFGVSSLLQRYRALRLSFGAVT